MSEEKIMVWGYRGEKARLFETTDGKVPKDWSDEPKKAPKKKPKAEKVEKGD